MVQMYSISALAETQRQVYTYQLKDLRRVSNYKKIMNISSNVNENCMQTLKTM